MHFTTEIIVQSESKVADNYDEFFCCSLSYYVYNVDTSMIDLEPAALDEQLAARQHHGTVYSYGCLLLEPSYFTPRLHMVIDYPNVPCVPPSLNFIDHYGKKEKYNIDVMHGLSL